MTALYNKETCEKVVLLAGLSQMVLEGPPMSHQITTHFVSRQLPIKLSARSVSHFHSLVSKSEGCWEWKGRKNKTGYGVFGDFLAHRCAYVIAFGDIPPATCVLHRCDNPACCNPLHLFPGSMADNVRDRDAKGRHPGNTYASCPEKHARGERMGSAKLRTEQVVEIRKQHSEGISQASLAGKYGVGRTTISQIVSRRTWTHV